VGKNKRIIIIIIIIIIGELGRMWKEEAVAYFKAVPEFAWMK
jgi:hypothetical protein